MIVMADQLVAMAMPSNTNTRAPLEIMGIIFIIFALGAVSVFADCDRWTFKKATAASKILAAIIFMVKAQLIPMP